MKIKIGPQLYQKAKKLIPGGTQLLSKRPEIFLPELWPAYYSMAKGCEIWDLDGNKYIDMSYMGVGTAILGYADEDVNQAVKEAIDKGNLATLNAPEEVELAEVLLELHPWAEMVRYARTGGEAMAVAVRIARAYSEKDIVLFCGYHGWHDWYLAANLADDKALDGHLLPGLKPKGVPRVLKGTAIPFTYNNTKEFKRLIDKHKNNIGVVVLEAVRNYPPTKEFLDTIRSITEELDIPLIVDEITSGFRLTLGGAHLVYNLKPDIAVFGKAISNGYPIAAIIGKAKFMDKAQESFISSTYWTDRIGPVAAIATIKKLKRYNVPSYITQVGEKIQKGLKELAIKHKLDISISGIPPLTHFAFNYPNALELKTLFTQLMLEKGFLASTGIYTSFAHRKKHIEAYLKAVDEVFKVISEAIKKEKVSSLLKAPVCHAGFKRLT